jgi:alkylhydroperoxidase/carboxymuconolactone decarboxylase family protein YurZ
VSTGLKMRPKHHLEMLDYYDHLDSDYARLWEQAIYHGMYSRWQIDDKTRLLCMVANCIAVGEAIQGRAHMLGAMRQGATAREVMEVIFQSVPSFGNPSASKAFTIFVKLMADAGRLDEIGNPTEPTRKQ